MTQTSAPRYARAAAVVRAQIADGTLRPGQPAPSGARLARLTGFSDVTCRRALRTLIADGTLVPGPSRNARPRVAAPAGPGSSDAARTLSRALSALRRASGLTQPQLAAITGYSVATVGHAETGRLWQSRTFWEKPTSPWPPTGNWSASTTPTASRRPTSPPFPRRPPRQHLMPQGQPRLPA